MDPRTSRAGSLRLLERGKPLKFLRLPAAVTMIAAILFTLGAPVRTGAADTGPVKIALITDMSGIYSALSGEGAVVAAKMAVAAFGGKVLGRPIEVDVIDHRNNGPESAVKAREALDGGADILLDMTNSAGALADTAVAKEKHKLAIATGAEGKPKPPARPRRPRVVVLRPRLQ